MDSGSTTPSRGPQRASPNDRDVLVIEVSLLRDHFWLWCIAAQLNVTTSEGFDIKLSAVENIDVSYDASV